MSNSLIPDTTGILLDGTGLETELYLSLFHQMKNYTDKCVLFTCNPKYKYKTKINEKCKVFYFESPLNYEDFAKFTIFEFYKAVETKRFITYHLDGYILNPHKWKDQFLDYDYIGAPWANSWKGEENLEPINVGNGGFSIRNVEFMKCVASIAHYENYNGVLGEDVYISVKLEKYLKKIGFTYAPIEIAKQFSVETPIDCGRECWHFINNTFGFHGKVWYSELKSYNYWVPEGK